MSQPYIEDLPAYFTEVKDLCNWFRGHVDATELRERLLVIHGIGGSGKSSLLRMFRMYCRGIGTPVALASGDEAKSAPAILSDWANDLKVDDVILPTFVQMLEHYRTIQAKVEDQTNKTLQEDTDRKYFAGLRQTLADRFNEGELHTLCFDLGIDYDDLPGASKSDKARELVAYLKRHRRISELIDTGQQIRPDVSWDGVRAVSPRALSNTLGSIDGAAYADIDLLLDPAKKLTDDFLADVERSAPKRRLVLMLDTFEQLSALENWARGLAQRLYPNVLLVIAGRTIPNWGRAWPGWLAQAHVEELKPMTDDIIRELVRGYYATVRGGEPDPKQVEAIIGFARGLPMVVTSAVQLWVEHGVEDFAAVKAEVVADLVDRLKEGVPEAMTSVLEAAATVRWFNKDILRAVTGQGDVVQTYDELRRFPFVRSRVEGLALHDAVREIMDEYLHVHDHERHRELHERAAGYFETQMVMYSDEDVERIEREILYHRVRADEKAGIEEFQKKAEDLTQGRFVDRLRALLNDANTYPLEYENSKLWRQYYGARLAHLEARFAEAEKAYQEIAENEQAESKLEAYARCDWGTLMAGGYKRLGTEDAIDKTVDMLKKSLGLTSLDLHLSGSLFGLARVARRQGDWEKQNKYLEEAKFFFEKQKDQHGIATVYAEMRRAYARRGLWKDFLNAHESAEEALSKVSQPVAAKVLEMTLLGDWGWSLALAGRPAKCVENARRASEIADELKDDVSKLHALRDLAWGLGAQDRFADSEERFGECLAIVQQRKLAVEEKGSILGFWGAVLGRKGDYAEAQRKLEESLKIKDEDRERDIPGIQEPLIWLGLALELQRKWAEAEERYQQNQKYKRYRHYFDATALTGLVRVKHAQHDYDVIPALLLEAEALAQQYEYNDHFASLRLTQGHVAWDGRIPDWGGGFDAARQYYQQALIYALRYNRFLLDEALSGRPLRTPGGTPLRPIIPHCLERGEEGQRMLAELRDWWEKGDVGAPHTDTISLITKDMPLLKAESATRDFEPGDGSPQRPVLEQIDEAISR